ncbi:ankyrin repeat-containing protein ITN1-like isoform X1 [Neltuma alba]|uniref:ankyrin repeat-containing protein ITN1-like isoform X1 n=1 Tax=Neltuma alba TaxID=207710 RepID=UPI0010A59220|nr:ankyrin repeat-containing protein ITN1-like isoform X1 [Prosopis alba]XP_028783203.1 ankyrin repeat-containing protein ITN1-like isoform X1 [Prosopis alba]
MAVADESSVTIPTQQLQRVASAQFRTPNLNLIDPTQERRDKYTRFCVPLHKAALKGDWKAAKHILDQDRGLARAAITKGWSTVLHVAAEANHVHFVEELVKEMDREDLELQDQKGNTAFSFAAAAGNMQIVEIMKEKNNSLPWIRGGAGVTPLHMAALQGQSDMAWHLYAETIQVFEDVDRIVLLFYCVYSGIYDLALKLLETYPDLAFERDTRNNETILHILARKPLSSICQSQRYRKRLMKTCLRQTQQLQLVKHLWSIFLAKDDGMIMDNIREPAQVTFIAVEVGNFEFLAELISTYPDLIWEVNGRNQTIIHVAILRRYADIFNLIHDIGRLKDFIVGFEDSEEEGNLLHMAARLAPQDRLNIVSGAAFQMTFELSWFEEVKKIVPPSLIEMKNVDGLTPRQLFTEEHKDLLKEAESWMKKTAKSSMLVSTLITTGVFTAVFSIPGGIDDKSGNPNYLGKPSFLIFAISDAIAMISSSTSILIFLSILISRYAEDDFHKSLPLKLISGLVALFISIISMMIAFSSAFFIMFCHGSKWVPNFISALAFIPIPLFVFLLFPLWSDILYWTYFCRNIFRPSKHMLY